MSTKYKIRTQQHPYFLTFAVVSWVDVFTRKAYKDILLESLQFCQQQKGLELYAYCIMPNHLHLIAGTKEGTNLSHVLRDFKKFTASAIIRAIQENPQESRRDWMLWIFKKHGERNGNNTNFQFWQQDSHPIELSNNKLLKQKLEYIHQNPVRAGICYAPEDYIYSSASQYAGGEAALPVTLLE
ncbi:MAG: transposase [Hymenobacteraceae bacterium]|nr:transposase [Hymenobacteraceae bacterium]MDX5397617.1 transposase [Hymenobacteraceae bacterium]MDX5513697.1 transposase [Hymenobacteraceae bacterium]